VLSTSSAHNLRSRFLLCGLFWHAGLLSSEFLQFAKSSVLHEVWIVHHFVINHSVSVLAWNLVVGWFHSLGQVLAVDRVKSSIVTELLLTVGLFMSGILVVVSF
jgi:hypothetical protein